MMTNNSLFGVCIKLGEITNNIVGTKQEIVPGELVKMFEVNRAEKSNSYVIKLYDRPNKRFTRELYQCDKAIINQLNENTFSYASELTEGNNITVNLDMPEGKTKVNFSIKSIGINVPQLGAGYFFALDFIDNPNLSEDIKRSIQLKYFVHKESALCIRGDRLIERMIIDQPSSIQPVISSKPNNYNPQFKPKITAEPPPLISFVDGNDVITRPPSMATYIVPTMDSDPNKKIGENRHAIPNDPQLTVLDKVNEISTSFINLFLEGKVNRNRSKNLISVPANMISKLTFTDVDQKITENLNIDKSKWVCDVCYDETLKDINKCRKCSNPKGNHFGLSSQAQTSSGSRESGQELILANDSNKRFNGSSASFLLETTNQSIISEQNNVNDTTAEDLEKTDSSKYLNQPLLSKSSEVHEIRRTPKSVATSLRNHTLKLDQQKFPNCKVVNSIDSTTWDCKVCFTTNINDKETCMRCDEPNYEEIPRQFNP